MKKILSFMGLVLLSISVMGQWTKKSDLILLKTTPLLHLYGTGGIIKFNNVATITYSTGYLTLASASLLTSGTSYIGIGATAPLHQLVIASSTTNGLNALNIVNSTINKNRTSLAQARDSSSFNLWYTITGSPTLSMTSKTGTNIVTIDSSKVSLGVPGDMYTGDTTVTAIKGRVVFKTSDSVLYVCRSTYTNHARWFKLTP
jgi:hypothetical protein